MTSESHEPVRRMQRCIHRCPSRPCRLTNGTADGVDTTHYRGGRSDYRFQQENEPHAAPTPSRARRGGPPVPPLRAGAAAGPPWSDWHSMSRPRSSMTRVGGTHDGAIVARVMEPAREGRATAAAVRAVADALGVAPGSVTLVQGAATRRKLIEIAVPDAAVAEFQGRLRRLGSQ
jgi:uncharacterized protein YggU (UPF0235/DUF167 family)